MTDEGNRFLGKLIVARTGQGDFNFVGRCISYCDQPTIGVQLPDGSRANWVASLCEVIEICPEAIEAIFSLDRKADEQ